MFTIQKKKVGKILRIHWVEMAVSRMITKRFIQTETLEPFFPFQYQGFSQEYTNHVVLFQKKDYVSKANKENLC